MPVTLGVPGVRGRWSRPARARRAHGTSHPSRATRLGHTPQVEAPTATRHRPFGVIIVALEDHRS